MDDLLRIELHKLVSNDQYEDLFEKLAQIAQKLDDKNLSSEISLLSAQYHSTQKELNKGLLKREDFILEKNKVSNSLISIIDDFKFNKKKILGPISGIYKDHFPKFPEKTDYFYIEQYKNNLHGIVQRVYPEVMEYPRKWKFNGYIESNVLIGHFWPLNLSHSSKGSLFLTRQNITGHEFNFSGYYLREEVGLQKKNPYGIEKIEMSLEKIDNLPDQYLVELLLS